MAKLPDKYALSGPASLRSGRVLADWDTSGIGRGVAALGAGLRSVGGEFSAIGEQQKREGIVLDGAAADGGAMKELSDFERGFDADADFGTFEQRFEKGRTAIRDKWAAKITDPKARQKWSMGFDQNALGARNRVLDLGLKRVREGKLVDYKSGLEGFQSVIADANVSEAERARAKDSANAWMDAASGQGLLSPSEADTWRKNVIEGGEFVLGQRLIEQDPSVISGKLPASVSGRSSAAMSYFTSRGWTKEQAAGIVGNLIGESKLDTGARNPGDGSDGTDSIGIGQWNSDRARALKEFAAQNRADWRDFNIQLAFVDHELRTSESAAGNALKAAGTVDDATAAFAGYERPAGWSAANPRGAHNYKGRLTYAAQAAGETIKPDWYANQSPDNQLRLENMAASRQGQLDAAAAAQSKAERDGANDDFRLRIAAGDPSLLPGDILGDSRIDNGQKASLLNTYNEKYEENIRTGIDIQALQGGALSLNAFDTDDQKRADNVYDTLMKSVEDSPNPSMDPVAARQYISESIVRSGVVPKGMMDMLRAGVQSTNTADVAAALQQAQRISQINPAALGRRDGGAAVQSAADDFSYYVNGLNLSPEDAARRIMEARDPEKMRGRKALEPLAKDFMKQASETDLADMFDPGMFSGEPSLGFNAAQEAGMKADFMAIAEDQFYRANGDPELALNRAEEQMKRLYGVTSMASDATVMKHPPEKYWPAQRDAGGVLGIGANPWQYVQTQLHKDISEQFGAYEDGSVTFTTVPETDAAIKRGEMPGYVVMWKDENGQYQSFPGKLWKPDTSVLKHEDNRLEGAARRQQDMIRDLLPSLTEEAERFRRSPTPGDVLNPFRSFMGGGEAPQADVPAPQPDTGDLVPSPGGAM